MKPNFQVKTGVNVLTWDSNISIEGKTEWANSFLELFFTIDCLMKHFSFRHKLFIGYPISLLAFVLKVKNPFKFDFGLMM